MLPEPDVYEVITQPQNFKTQCLKILSSGDGAVNLEPHLMKIISEISTNEQIWYSGIDQFLLGESSYKPPTYNGIPVEYKY